MMRKKNCNTCYSRAGLPNHAGTGIYHMFRPAYIHMWIILIIDLQAWQPCKDAYRHRCRPTNLVEAHTDMYLSGPVETYGEQGKDMSRTTCPVLKQAYNS